MQNFTRPFITLAILFLLGQQAQAQCTTGTKFPSSNVTLPGDNSPTILSDLCYCGEFSRCTNVTNGKSYTVTSSVATDFITVTNANGSTNIAWGTQPVTFTAPSNADFRVYRHVSSACGAQSVFRTITVGCNDCIIIPNNTCANATNLGAAPITVAGSNVNASNEGIINYASCDFSIGGLNDVWYKFTTDANGGNATVTFNGSFDGVMAVYTGCSTAAELDCADDEVLDPEVLSLTGLTAATVYYVRISGYDGASGAFNLSIAGTALPLELASFTGQAESNGNMLSWETLTEKNVQSHIVERSVDGANWGEIGRKAGQTLSVAPLKYSLEDRTPLAKAYYRLRSVDFDGQDRTSNAILLTRKGEQFGVTSVFPSPATDNTTVQFVSLFEETVTVRVLDMSGRQVLSQTVDAIENVNELVIPLNGLQAGVYTVTITNSTEVSAPVRFMKQ